MLVKLIPWVNCGITSVYIQASALVCTHAIFNLNAGSVTVPAVVPGKSVESKVTVSIPQRTNLILVPIAKYSLSANTTCSV